MKTAVVTGATGFIGGAVTKLLLEKKIKVYAVGRNPEKLQTLAKAGAIPVSLEFNEYLSMSDCIQETVDIVYHCAYAGGFDGQALRQYDLQLDNARHACDTVSSALKMGTKKFVYVSTVNVVEVADLIDSYECKPRYTCIYSAGKLVAELIGKTLSYNGNMEYITALVAMPYGEGNSANTLPNIIMKQLMDGVSPKLIEGNNGYGLVYIDDVAKAMYSIGEKGENFKRYYVGHRKLSIFKELMCGIRDVISPDTELQFGAYPDAPALNYDEIDLDALYHDTGFECKANFEESILKTAQWLKKQENNYV